MSDWVVTHQPCPCGASSDAYSVNAEGWGKCFSCGKNFKADGTEHQQGRTMEKKPRDLVGPVEFAPLIKRKIDEKTCRLYGYGWVDYKGKRVQAAPYHAEGGGLVAQKLRFADKSMTVLGKMPGTFFGQHLFQSGRRLVITEGEIDAMSAYQVISSKHQWPVVSVPNGAQGAEKAFRQNLAWLESFEEVVIAFDMDEPGQTAALKCAPLLTPGKVRLAKLPAKDPNEALQKGLAGDLYEALWRAPVWRPDGLINAADLLDEVLAPTEMGIPYPWPRLNEKTFGQHPRRIVTWTAGSGVGKSAFVREAAYDIAFNHGQQVGYIALEESVGRTAKGFVGLHLSKPIHLPGHDVPGEVLKQAFDETLGTQRIWLYDHFGSLEDDHLFNHLRWLAAQGCTRVVLDHLSIVISGLSSDEGERKDIDRLMTKLRQFVEQTGVGLDLVSHLSRPKQGKGHEDGTRPSLAELRGSHGIVQLSDFVIGLQRKMSSGSNLTSLWVLKNRLSGDTGLGTVIRYDKDTGRLHEVDYTLDEDGDPIVAPDLDDGDGGGEEAQGGSDY